MKLKSLKFRLYSLILSLGFLALAGVGFAQDEPPAGPVYIVQAGDTLTTIALKFGVPFDELLISNGLSSSDLIFVGDSIIIPGLEGITGVLETQIVPYGESLRSLSRRYQIPIEKLVKLNRLVSPSELYAGASLIIPVISGEVPQPGRAGLSPGQSGFELAVRKNINPWTLAAYNGFSSPSRLVPGDVYFLPGQIAAGPGAFPDSISNIQVSEIYQGETAVVKIQAESGLDIQGKLLNREFKLFNLEDGSYAGLQGVHALSAPGLYPLEFSGALADSTTISYSQLVLIRPRGYLFEVISVPPELIDPETTNKEEEFVRPLVTTVSSHRFWQGLFVSPSPCPTCINSSFGNRRSYNGSAFSYFHGGVDFPPVSLEITASADGMVAFADFLEVRGNFTLIDHGWGVLSAYLHQSEIFVQAGEMVKAGQVIGLIGNTGRSTGAHLHWEIWVGGVQVNPLDWLETLYP
jgi:murein DD-endopeptidase MepM/ murein hydrolase activator NlpD